MPTPHRHTSKHEPPTQIHAISQTLDAIFLHDTLASKAITTTIHNQPEFTNTDKAHFTTLVYDLVRYWRLLWYIQNQPPTIRDHDIADLITTYRLTKKALTTPTQPVPTNPRLTQALQNRALRESIPDWIDTLAHQELGIRWNTVLHALNTTAPLTIRTNTLKTTRPRLIIILKHEGLITQPLIWAPDALRIAKPINVFQLESFHQGLFEVQDAASQMASRLLDPQPGSRVLDACAGEGGKTLHLAALMKNKGRIIALDPAPHHLEELRRRATRAGADTIETRVIDKTTKRLTETMDRVLIDAPCSGLGTLRRNPDIKWKLTPDALARLRSLQRDLLETYAPIVKPGGIIAYSVCSILPSEGERQTAAFTKHHKNYQTLREQRYWPDTDNTDGFYIALLKRTA